MSFHDDYSFLISPIGGYNQFVAMRFRPRGHVFLFDQVVFQTVKRVQGFTNLRGILVP